MYLQTSSCSLTCLSIFACVQQKMSFSCLHHYLLWSKLISIEYALNVETDIKKFGYRDIKFI